MSTLIAFVWIRSSANKRFSRILNAFVNIREFFQLVREEYTMTNGLSIVLTIVYAFSSGLFIYQVNEHYHIFAVTFEPFLFYLSVVACIAGFSIFKLLFSRIIGAVFYNKTDQILPFVYNIFLTNNIIGIVLLPASICLAYIVVIPRDYTIGAALIIILIIYIYRIVRSLSISLNESAVSNVYFFLYLCTLDFIPLIVLLKQLTNQF